MKISNLFVIKLVVVTILFKIASECGASEHCIPSSYNVNPENIVTASGFTPKEAWNNFHTQLPQIGVLQNVKLKKYNFKTNDVFNENLTISKSIFANFDYVTKYQCKKGSNYIISAIIPRKTINYIPLKWWDIEENKQTVSKYLSFAKKKNLCGKESYHLVTSNWTINFTENGNKSFRTRRIEGSNFRINKEYKALRIMVICGFNWHLFMTNKKSLKPELIQNTWHHIVENKKLGIQFINYTKYMQLQMISNAIKGE